MLGCWLFFFKGVRVLRKEKGKERERELVGLEG